jgi:hypothetical protein
MNWNFIDIPAWRKVSGTKVSRNTVKNVARAVDGSGARVELNNFVHAQTAGVSYNAGSKGVGNVPRGSSAWTCIVEDSAPTSATFGQFLSVPLLESNAMPRAGLYVAGHFVKNSMPAVVNGKVLRGWHRLQTNSTHVLDSAWAADYGTTP